jgi:glycosyltransferase involved in cell wall biosynthesis
MDFAGPFANGLRVCDLVYACHPAVLAFLNRWFTSPRRALANRIWRKGWRVLRGIAARTHLAARSRDKRDDFFEIGLALAGNVALFREALTLRPDVIHCNDLDTLLAGFMVKQATGAKLVYDAHEVYPEQFAEGVKSPDWKQFYTRLESTLLPFTDARLTVCDTLGEYFRDCYGTGAFVTVRNVPSRRLLAPPAVLERRSTSPRILYHGMYFANRGLEEVILAARWLRGAVVVFRGLGPQERALRQLVARQRLGDRVQFLPPVPVEDLIPRAAECEIGLCPFPPACKNTLLCLPNKFFEYLSAGLALACTDLVEMRRLTTRHEVGVLIDSNDPKQMADTLMTMVSDSGALNRFRRNAYEAARTEYYWEKESVKLTRAYEEHLAASGRVA